MKTVFTLILAALFTLTAVAQDLSLSTENLVLDASGAFELGDITLTNNSSEAIEVAVRLERICMTDQDETKIQICIGTLCFAAENQTTVWGETSGTAYLTIEPGASDNQFSFHQLPHGSSESEWDLVFFDRNNPTTEAVLNVSIEDPTLEPCSPPDLRLNVDNIVLGPNENIELGSYIRLINNSDNAIETAIRLERVVFVPTDETRIEFILSTLSFPSVNETTTWGDVSASPYLILEPNTFFNEFSLRQLPQGSYESKWNLVFFDRNNPATSATLTVCIEGGNLLSGTNDFDYTIEKAYPNPALDVINIAYDIDVNEADLNIYNSTGILVETVVVNPQAKLVTVNVANYVNGVYFYNVTDGKEQSKMMSFVK